MTCLSLNQALANEGSGPRGRRGANGRVVSRGDPPVASSMWPRGLRSPGRGFEVFKRAMDAAASGARRAAVSPVLILAAAWIAAVSLQRGGGGEINSQWRAGREGYLFRIYKLRTMRCDAEARGARFASAGDPRVLPGCHWMRRSHVDELPQLWNILKGDMSLVGPRPERPEMFEALCGAAPRFERRLAGKPGLTGLAQLRRGYTNDARGARAKLAWDLRYLRRRSILGDVQLMIQTLPKFWDDAAC